MNDKSEENVSDAMLMALADGELNERDAKQLERRIARDQDLQARYARFTETRDALRAALEPGPMPDRLIKTAQATSTNARSARVSKVSAVAWPISLAASLVVGIGLGWMLTRGQAKPSEVGLVEVAQATGPAATGQTVELRNGSRVRALGTFKTVRGICRLISVVPPEGYESRFVACRSADAWQIALSVELGSGETIAPASDTAVELIDGFLDSIEAGPPLMPGVERAVLSEFSSP